MEGKSSVVLTTIVNRIDCAESVRCLIIATVWKPGSLLQHEIHSNKKIQSMG